MINKEDTPFFLIITTIGGVLLALFAAMMGITPYERRIAAILLFSLLWWNILAVSLVTFRLVRLVVYGYEAWYKLVKRYRLLYERTLQRLQEAEQHIAELNDELQKIRNRERSHQSRLAERERDVAAARKHAEDVRAAAQEQLQRAHEQIKQLQALLKAKEEL
jgi:Chromosome segregation ATPases